MKRALIVVGATAAGIAATVSFKPHVATTAAVATAAASAAATPSASSTGGAFASGTQTAVGSDVQLADGLGDIQVRITVSNGTIVKVGMAKMNLNGPQSQEISNNVIPQLEQQTLDSNGTAIQGVSGATYTTQAYEESLQAALDQLG